MFHFDSLEGLAHHLLSHGIAETDKEVAHGLEKAAQLLETEAKGEFGQYQPAVGPFAAWSPLAESTKADRVAKGFPEDEPLLRTGALRDSIKHEVDGHEATVGSEEDVMLYQELGTARIPPRPVLGTALYTNIDKIVEMIGGAAHAGLSGGREIDPTLGYSGS